MTSICFISTYLNHHNKPLCDILVELTEGHFHYVAASNIGAERKQMGFSQMEADYLLDYANATDKESIQKVVDDADVVLIGASEPVSLVKHRLKQGKLTFRCSERIFKTKSRYLKAPIHWLRGVVTRKSCLLCCSAKAARDYNLIGLYRNRSYKWGYFTEVPSIDVNAIWDEKIKERQNGVSILWVARLIPLKHPEVPIQALKKLKDDGYRFDFNIIGDGPIATDVHKLIDDLGMNDCVHLLGSKPTTEVRRYMERSEIFIFSSNGQEGWGAVMNESMSCACAPVANSEIGSIPFLIKDKVNGMIYHKNSVDSLVERLKPLLDSESYRRKMGEEAYKTISELWTPRKAAENLLALVDSIQNKTENPIKEGPCSISK